MRYDLIVVGSGPAGQKAAIAAAKQNWRVAIVERKQELLGGVSLHTGTIPSKTIREAILHLTGYRHRDVYEESYRRKREITMDDLRLMIRNVGQTEWQVLQDQFARNRVDVVCGEASFVDPHRVEVTGRGESQILEGRHILLAPGTRPSRPDHIPFNGKTVFDSDEILSLSHVPRSMIVVGGGVIGLEYAIMFATLGVQVTVIDGRAQLLEFCDREIIETLLHHARSLGMIFRLGESVVSIREPKPGRVAVELESGKRLLGETVLFSVGRTGDTDALQSRPRRPGSRQTRPHRLQLAVPNHRAAHLRRRRRRRLPGARQHLDGTRPPRRLPHDGPRVRALPNTCRTACSRSPKSRWSARTKKQLTEQRVPYEVGMARFSEIARGQIAGDHTGHAQAAVPPRNARSCWACTSSANRATEIIHIGQAVMALGGTIDYFRDTVFNYPTMAECYKVAALDGLNKLSLWEEAESTVRRASGD